MINSQWLVSFVAFAEELSFTRAATRLHVSQPALHVQVQKLTEQVGAPLYERHGRGVRLTPQGTALLAHGREAMERAEEVLHEVRGGSSSQPIVLASGEGAYLYLIGGAIRAFNKQGVAPLRLLSRDQAGTIEAVRSGLAHVGVTAVEEAPAGIEAELLLKVGAMVVLPRRHRLAKKRRVQIHDLEQEQLVVPPTGKPHRAALARAFLNAGVAWEPAIEASGWELILHFAKLGLGLAIVNDCCRVPSGMVARPVPELPRVPYHIVRRASAHPRKGVEELCDAIRAELPER